MQHLSHCFAALYLHRPSVYLVVNCRLVRSCRLCGIKSHTVISMSVMTILYYISFKHFSSIFSCAIRLCQPLSMFALKLRIDRLLLIIQVSSSILFHWEWSWVFWRTIRAHSRSERRSTGWARPYYVAFFTDCELDIFFPTKLEPSQRTICVL